MLKAFSYLFAFVVICLVGIFGWLSFIDVPIEQQTVEQAIALPDATPPSAMAPEVP